MRRGIAIRTFVLVMVMFLYATSIVSINPNAVISPSHGPNNGTLFLTGGASLPNFLTDEFARLAGGKNCRLLVVPTASTNPTATKLITTWTNKGFTNVTSLHTTDRNVANTDAFASAVDTADAIWFNGGDPVLLSRPYVGTKTLDAFKRLLDRGGVIGGESAGSMAQGEWDALYMVDPPLFQLAAGTDFSDYPMLGFVPGLVVIPHINTGGIPKWNWCRSIIRNHPEALGVGIYEAKGLILKKDILRVHGDSLGIYDSTTIRYTNLKGNFLMLYHGETYDIGTRKQLNFRPQIQGFLPTQTIPINTPFQIDLPFVFSDVNESDSLSLTATSENNGALPSWINFDPTHLTLTGTSPLQGLISIRITASDRSGSYNSVLVTLQTTLYQNLLHPTTPLTSLYYDQRTKKLECRFPKEHSTYYRIDVYDLVGKKCSSNSFEAIGTKAIDVAGLNGIYLITIHSENNVQKQKIQFN